MLALLMLSSPFHAERHLVVTTYEGIPVQTALNLTDHSIVTDDSLSLAGTDGNVIMCEALRNIRSIAVRDIEPTSVESVPFSSAPTDSASVSTAGTVIRMEDGSFYIYRDNHKFTINGVPIK